MGFMGEVIVVRSSAEARELGPFVDTETHEVRFDLQLKDGWRAIHVRPHDEPYKYDGEWLAEVSANTGAPVLACWVFESDVAHIRGLSEAGAWQAWLNVPYGAQMAVQEVIDEIGDELEERGGQEEINRFGTRLFKETYIRLHAEIPDAALMAVEWARDAGYVVPVGPVEDLLAGPRELFIQLGFFKLLYRLGLTETEFDPEE